jgi:hypothetical protein
LNKILIKDKSVYFFKRFNSLPVICAFSDRTFNLGLDNVSAVQLELNRRRFLKVLGINCEDLVCVRQIHSAKVICVSARHKEIGSQNRRDILFACDGMITKERGLALAVLSADCLPIFLYDLKNHAGGILHVGWRGTYRNIVQNAIYLMKRRFKTESANLIVGFGPAIRSCCYEVGPRFKKYFKNKLLKKTGRLYLDLITTNKKILISLGVKRRNILDSKICTSCESKDFFSYRKEGDRAGRIMSVMMLTR